MSKKYETRGSGQKKKVICNIFFSDDGALTLDEIIKIAKTEFPGVDFNQLEIDAEGRNAEFIILSLI